MNQLLALNELELLLVAYLGGCHYPVSIKKMGMELEIEMGVMINAILNLKINHYIKQIDKDIEENIFWNSEEAHYEINKLKKAEINQYLAYEVSHHKVRIKGDYIWYVAYGSDILYEKFLHYIRGGICQFNHKEYYGCSDQSLPLASLEMIIPYEAYVAGNNPSWHYKGVIFIDTHKPGETLGRAYLVKAEQYEEIRDQAGRSSEWYDKEVDLGMYLGIPIKAITNKTRKVINIASSKYQKVVEAGIKETYRTKTEKEIEDYLYKIFEYEVELSESFEGLKEKWDKELLLAQALSSKERQERLAAMPIKPKRIITTKTFFAYNPLVIAERLALAEGKCERCGKETYLEVHHIKSLREEGEDTLANTIALCPNCHKEIHLGEEI